MWEGRAEESRGAFSGWQEGAEGGAHHRVLPCRPQRCPCRRHQEEPACPLVVREAKHEVPTAGRPRVTDPRKPGREPQIQTPCLTSEESEALRETLRGQRQATKLGQYHGF